MHYVVESRGYGRHNIHDGIPHGLTGRGVVYYWLKLPERGMRQGPVEGFVKYEY